jgi:large conductance mechanosensitive channel
MLSEFKQFIAKGNVMELAVAVIIGGAFATIVKSLTEEVIMPLVGAMFGGADFSAYFILLSVPEGYAGAMDDYAALKEAGAAMIGYGAFATAVINFVILAFIIFLLVRYTAKVMAEHSRLRQVANGRSVPVNAPVMLSTQAPAATPAQAVPAASRNAGERPSAEADSKVALLGSVGS